MSDEDPCSNCTHFQLQITKLKSENKRLKERLQKALGTCPMIGLLNKSRMMKEIERNFLFYERGMRKNPDNEDNHFSIIFIDIDEFTKYNEISHLFADKLIIEFGNYLSDNIRNIDLVARFGGDEFYILAPTTSKERAETLASKIRSGLSHYVFALDEMPTYLTASYGVASTSDKLLTPYALVSKADERMYREKAKKRLSIK
ncbi:MAG: GGDEF domain-containing protein [Patescibacteria group bacterium]